MNKNNSQIVIRQLKIRDIPAFIRLKMEIENETLFMPTNKNERKKSIFYSILKMLFQRKTILTFIALKDGKLVGYLSIIFSRFNKFRGNSYISNVSVKSSLRGQGVGKMLFQAAEECACDRKVRRIELEVFSKNKTAFDLFTYLGWEIEGRKRQSVETQDGYDDLIFMAKFLK